MDGFKRFLSCAQKNMINNNSKTLDVLSLSLKHQLVNLNLSFFNDTCITLLESSFNIAFLLLHRIPNKPRRIYQRCVFSDGEREKQQDGVSPGSDTCTK